MINTLRILYEFFSIYCNIVNQQLKKIKEEFVLFETKYRNEHFYMHF